ncbi:hypothetical protein N7492_009969 [Penicillium capsulatum]|uniref:Uncharacterized protein n=1 Tax=Penicillium capsulatum TaxID=69766 RepID=A0A9W9LEI6_9EURO|nr:hypothetical protein N7492_009969 [Penicillium capsulatum]KAJ6112479.1 hypothetical protein N7512_007803 [Penicillium capsulatum]
MSLTTTSAASASPTCTSIWDVPTRDIACGSTITGNMTDVFDQCCKGDAPVKFKDDCGIYCLAQGQTVRELQECLNGKSNNYHDIFCNGGKPNATATAAASTTRSTATGTKTSSSTSTSTENAAVGQPLSKSGLGVVAMLFCSAMMGVLA